MGIRGCEEEDGGEARRRPRIEIGKARRRSPTGWAARVVADGTERGGGRKGMTARKGRRDERRVPLGGRRRRQRGGG